MTKKLLYLLLALPLVLGACGKKNDEEKIENAIEKASGGKADVDLSEGRMSIETEDGEKMEMSTGDDVQVPEDFPKDIHLYKGAKVESSIKTGNAIQLTLQTSDAAGKVADAYKKEMADKGWKEDTSIQTGDMTMLQYSKDSRNSMVHITAGKDKTTILLTESKEESE